MRTLLFYLLILVFLSLSLGVKAAPLATARAYLDWSQLTIRTFDVTGNGALSITWDSESYYQWAQAWAYEDYQYDGSNSWGSLSVSASMGGASARVTLLDNASMEVYSDPVEFTTWASARAERYGTFTVSGEGFVVIGIPYEIEVSLNSPSAYAYAGVYLNLSDQPEGQRWSSAGAELWEEGSDDGWIWVSFYFHNGDTGYFSASLDTYTSSPVPLPGTFVLLGSALLGLSLGRKKFFKK